MRWPLFLLCAAAASAQGLSVGVRGGAPLNDFFDSAQTRFREIPHRYIVGPTFEVRLPANLGISLDVLYQRLEVDDNGAIKTGSVWEFPIMLRKRFGKNAAKPFLAGGVSINRLSPGAITDPAAFFKTSTTGIVVGAGVELKALFLKFTPEIRYTHRIEENFRIGNLISSGKEQFTVLLGVTF